MLSKEIFAEEVELHLFQKFLLACLPAFWEHNQQKSQGSQVIRRESSLDLKEGVYLNLWMVMHGGEEEEEEEEEEEFQDRTSVFTKEIPIWNWARIYKMFQLWQPFFWNPNLRTLDWKWEEKQRMRMRTRMRTRGKRKGKEEGRRKEGKNRFFGMKLSKYGLPILRILWPLSVKKHISFNLGYFARAFLCHPWIIEFIPFMVQFI